MFAHSKFAEERIREFWTDIAVKVGESSLMGRRGFMGASRRGFAVVSRG